MKWLELSLEKFEPIPDISFAVKKSLFAASVVLKYSRAVGSSSIEATAEAQTRIPIKGELKYRVQAVFMQPQSAKDIFSFSTVIERDVTAGSSRKIEAQGSALKITKSRVDGASEKQIEIQSDSPVPILAHLFILPAFQQSRDETTDLYGAYISVGANIQAVRLQRIGKSADVETYVGKFMTVPRALDTAGWSALPWDSKKSFEFDWVVGQKTIGAARVTVPFFGQLEIKN